MGPPDVRDFTAHDDRLTPLVERVTDALRALPNYFSSRTTIEGIQAKDLFSLNSMLGTTLEVQVVDTLNRMRDVWDPDDDWPLHRCDRQAQQFPDVLLRKQTDTGSDVALGIELKAGTCSRKKRSPVSATKSRPTRVALGALLAVVPWHLSNVPAGTPQVGMPGIWPARFAAAYRNWWWQYQRTTTTDTAIKHPEGVQPYQRRGHTVDKPVADSGGNFGRLARVGIMGGWVNSTLNQPLAGVLARDWVTFLLDKTKEASL